MIEKSSTSKKTLSSLADEICSCRKCPLYKNRLNTVPGVGNQAASIVFIGEGPGAQEDKQGLPFVGASGKFLDEMLESVELKREDVFVTNIVKCRPLSNRDPSSEETDICSQLYLWKQLEIINPKLIVSLGRHAMYRFISKDKKISDVHGKLFQVEDPKGGNIFNFLPLYHPAAALYNGSMRGILKEDFAKIPKFLKKIA